MTTDQTAHEVTLASRQVKAAKKALADMEAAVVAGDDTITASDLGAAADNIRHTELLHRRAVSRAEGTELDQFDNATVGKRNGS